MTYKYLLQQKFILTLEFSDNLSSLGIPGTRQTLYLSGEENVSKLINTS